MKRLTMLAIILAGATASPAAAQVSGNEAVRALLNDVCWPISQGAPITKPVQATLGVQPPQGAGFPRIPLKGGGWIELHPPSGGAQDKGCTLHISPDQQDGGVSVDVSAFADVRRLTRQPDKPDEFDPKVRSTVWKGPTTAGAAVLIYRVSPVERGQFTGSPIEGSGVDVVQYWVEQGVGRPPPPVSNSR